MTITDIDKQVETWFKNQLGTAGDEQKLKNLVNQIYSQAKAEQREEDAKIVEIKSKSYKGGETDGQQRKNWSRQGYRQACYDIASEIRGQQ